MPDKSLKHSWLGFYVGHMEHSLFTSHDVEAWLIIEQMGNGKKVGGGL